MATSIPGELALHEGGNNGSTLVISAERVCGKSAERVRSKPMCGRNRLK